jgi:sulfur carrier protein
MLDTTQSRSGIAVAVNGVVVPRCNWVNTILSPGDTVDIVKPFQGG